MLGGIDEGEMVVLLVSGWLLGGVEGKLEGANHNKLQSTKR